MKKLVDAAVRAIYKALPAWQADETIEALPARPGYRYTLPENVDALPVRLKAAFTDIADSLPTLPVRHVHKVSDVSVSWHGTVFRNFRLFIPSLFYPTLADQYANSFLLKQWIGKHIAAPGQAVVAVAHDQFSAINYFHWLIEALPKLLAIRSLYPDCLLALPAPVPEYVEITTSLLGLRNKILIGQHQILKAAQVVVAESTLLNGHQDAVLVNDLRRELLTALGISHRKAGRRIYVSRSRQRMRKVVNEEALEALLAQYAFETVFFEELTFTEQVELAAETDILIGVHGANLTNTLFMPAGATVIELMNQDFPNLVYFRMASYLSLRYFSVPCRVPNGEEVGNNSNLVVDPTFVAPLLARLLGGG